MSRRSANTNVQLGDADFGSDSHHKQSFIPPAVVVDVDTTEEFRRNAELVSLSKLVRAKFRGSVDIYFPTVNRLASYTGNALATTYNSQVIAIRPHDSNLATAIVKWDASTASRKGWYTIYSPRVKKVRRLLRATEDGNGVYPLAGMVTAVQDCKRAASFISGLASYGDTEMASFVADQLGGIVRDDIGAGKAKLSRLFLEFRSVLNRPPIATEILQILDCVMQNRPAHIPPQGALYAPYNAFDIARKQVEEKQSHVGVLAPMFMFRAARNNKIVVVAPREQLPPYTKSYSSFDDLPQDIKRVVMTLEVKEKDFAGKVEGVGIVAHKDITLCTEACGFEIPKATLDSFILDVEKTSTYIEGQDDRL